MPTTESTETASETTNETTETATETAGTATETTDTDTETTENTPETTGTATETTGTGTTETATDTTETATETTNTTTATTNTTTETATATTETTGTATETTETTTETTETTTTETADGESDADAELSAFVGKSSTRTAVLERLVTGPANAADIAARGPPNVDGMRGITGTLSVSKTRSAIAKLRDRGLVELLVDGETRVYSLAAKGERILFALERDD
jgi:DNA-binding transcriptional ArsR family regulator